LAGEVRQKRVLTASGATATMQLLIHEVPAADAPIDLLLIADPSKDKVLSYLSRSRCFVASSDAAIVGVCVPSRYLRTVPNCLICFVSRCGILAVAPDNAFEPGLHRYASHKGE